MKNLNKKITAIMFITALSVAGITNVAYANPTTLSVSSSSPAEESASVLERELQVLEPLSDSELKEVLDRSIAAHESKSMTLERFQPGTVTPQGVEGTTVAPLIVVWAIGCGLAGISSLATGAWSTASGSAWAIAGILVSCIPGATQASLVKTILSNKVTVARALKAVGFSAAAAGLLKGDA